MESQAHNTESGSFFDLFLDYLKAIDCFNRKY